MKKRLLLGATLAAAALASAPLLADQADHRHGQNAAGGATHCPAARADHGGHAMGHGGMHGDRHAARAEGQHKGAHGAQHMMRGHAGEGCPMHGERKPT
jgi:hypothetical protein